MSDRLGFSKQGFTEYIYWQDEDRRTLKKINKLITDILRNAYTGIGHPEPLRGDLAGKWSREIDDKNRLVYEVLEDDRVEIYQCKGHYDDK